MKLKFILPLACFTLLCIASTVHSESLSAKPPTASNTQWRLDMQQLSKVVSQLMVNITSDQRFNDPANAKEILSEAQTLAKLVHNLQSMGGRKSQSIDADPSIPIIAGLFQQQARQAALELERGHREYARSLLKSATSYCMECHTRTTAPNMEGFVLKPDTKSLSKIEKAELLVAMRNFDAALKEYDAIASDIKLATDNPLAWERAVRNGLAVAVRVAQSPAQAIKLVNRILEMPNAPQATKADAAVWMSSLQDWQKEPKTKSPTVESLYVQAKHLIQQAQATQRYPADHSADILYLRASAVVHQLLRMDPNGPHTKEALYWAGLSYGSLHDLNLYSLNELYFEACVQAAPHTLIAKKCYDRYEDVMEAQYMGNVGGSLPSDVKKHLKELQKLAK